MKFSELTRDDVWTLRLMSALESYAPEIAEDLGPRRPSAILAGFKAWKARTPKPRDQQTERERSGEDI